MAFSPFGLAGEVGDLLEGGLTEHIFPNSSCLASASYDPVTGDLVVTFVNGNSAEYTVSPATWAGLISASSPGHYYNAAIKGSSGPRSGLPRIRAFRW